MENLKPGDILLYKPASWIEWFVVAKTWSLTSHCELYIGNGKSIASRFWGGCEIYDTRPDYFCVRRPTIKFSIKKCLDNFKKNYQGKPYDKLGFLMFVLLDRKDDQEKYICSEIIADLFKDQNKLLFAADYPSCKLAPAQYLQTVRCKTVA